MARPCSSPSSPRAESGPNNGAAYNATYPFFYIAIYFFMNSGPAIEDQSILLWLKLIISPAVVFGVSPTMGLPTTYENMPAQRLHRPSVLPLLQYIPLALMTMLGSNDLSSWQILLCDSVVCDGFFNRHIGESSVINFLFDVAALVTSAPGRRWIIYHAICIPPDSTANLYIHLI